MKLFLLKYPALNQIIRYGVIGILTNLMGYLVYLLLTFFLLDPKITVSILYPLSALIAYFSHMKHSFLYQGKRTGSLLRYILVYLMGYFLNITLILILHEKFQIPHQMVQVVAIVLVGFLLFFLLKYFVFPLKIKEIE